MDFLPRWNPKHRCQHHIDQRVISCCLDTVRVLAIRTANSELFHYVSKNSMSKDVTNIFYMSHLSSWTAKNHIFHIQLQCEALTATAYIVPICLLVISDWRYSPKGDRHNLQQEIRKSSVFSFNSWLKLCSKICKVSYHGDYSQQELSLWLYSSKLTLCGKAGRAWTAAPDSGSSLFRETWHDQDISERAQHIRRQCIAHVQ